MDLTTYFSDIDALMHLGAGACSELNDYLAAKPNKIVLVEADSELAKSLKKKASKEQSVTVLESLVSTGDDEKAFYRYSLPSTSSTRKGNELFSLYPSLKLVSEVHLPAQDVKQLISNEFDLTSNNALAIDLPGQEFEVLSSLFDSGLLNNLDKLIVYVNSEVLYGGEASLSDTYQLLVDHGFEELFSSIDVSDRKRYVMQRHPLYKQILDTKAEVKHVMQELTQSELQLATLQAKSKQSKSAHSKQIKAKDLKIDALNSYITELVQQLDEFKSKLDTAEVAYQKELLNKNNEIEALTSKITEQSLALEKVTAESKITQDELHKKLTSKETQLNELSKTLEQTKTDFESSKSASEQELTKARQEHENQIAEFEKTVSDKSREVEALTSKITEQSLALEKVTVESKTTKDELHKKLTAKETQLNELSKTLEQTKTEFESSKSASEQELTKARQEHENQIAEFEKTVSDKSREIEALTSKITEQSLALEKVTAESKATRDELHKKLTSKETQLNELSKTLEQTKTEFESSKSALEQELTKGRQEHESQIAEFEKTVSDKSTEVEALTSKVAEQSLALEKVTAESKATRDELHKKLTSKETQLNELSKTLEQSKAEFEFAKSALEQELASTKQNHDKQLSDKQAELSQLQEKLDQTHGWFVARKKQTEEQETQLAELNQKITQQVEELAALKAQKEALNSQLNEKTSLESQIQQLFDKQTHHLQQATNALGRHITETVDKGAKRVEAVMNVQRGIASPEYSLEYGTYNIKPELALFLTDKIKSNQYDLVIEFGAGTSTQVMAKLLFNKATDYQSTYQSNYHLEDDSTQHPVEKSQAPSAYELPKRLMSFEHSKQHAQKIQKNLEANNLQDTVELVYAPLVDVESQGKEYLFYDCKRKIDQIADIFDGRNAKILVLVDGPTSDGDSEDRFMALPSLLKSLSSHQLDIVLDDYHRETEQVIAQQWTALLDKRELSYQSNENSGAFWLSINGKELN